MVVKRIFENSGDVCAYFNSWYVSPACRGDLPNLPKQEFADLLFQYMDEAEKLPDGHTLIVELDDGRRLRFKHHLLGAIGTEHPELHEWAVELTTLNQATPRCLRKWRERKAWVYYHPYQGEGYKVRGKWSYSVYW